METIVESNPRFISTYRWMRKHVKARHFIEFGGTDASFKKFIPHDSWMMVDKYGKPDVIVDIDTPTVNLPFESNSVQYVICTEVLEHLRMGTPFLKEIYRILQPNGKLLASVPNMVSLRSRIKWLAGDVPFMAASGDCGAELKGTGVLKDGNWVGGHLVDFNKKRFTSYLERVGLKVNAWLSFDLYPFDGKKLRIPAYFVPTTLNDFLVVEATKR